MKYINYNFENVTSFLKFIGSRKESSVFSGRYLHSYEGDKSFTGTASYEDATNLLKYGDKDKLKMIKKSLEKIQAKGNGHKTRRKVKTSIVGCVPHIPNYLQGMPECMIDIVKTKIKSSKVLNIVYNLSIPCSVKTEDMSIAGAKILSYVASLEAQGYRVNLHVLWGTSTKDECVYSLIRIKSSDQYADLLKMAYPLVNTSMVRRHFFRYLEVCGVEDEKMYCGYGRPLRDLQEIKKLVKFDYYFDFKSAYELVI